MPLCPPYTEQGCGLGIPLRPSRPPHLCSLAHCLPTKEHTDDAVAVAGEDRRLVALEGVEGEDPVGMKYKRGGGFGSVGVKGLRRKTLGMKYGARSVDLKAGMHTSSHNAYLATISFDAAAMNRESGLQSRSSTSA